MNNSTMLFHRRMQSQRIAPHPGADAPSTKSQVTTSRPTIAIYQYLENASLHGLRYIGDRSISICER